MVVCCTVLILTELEEKGFADYKVETLLLRLFPAFTGFSVRKGFLLPIFSPCMVSSVQKRGKGEVLHITLHPEPLGER